MAVALPSQIVGYLDSRYPAAGEEKPFYVGRDHAASVAFILRQIDNLPPGIITLQGTALAEFGEAVEAVRVAVDAWASGDNQYQLKKIPGSNKLNPLTFIRKHLASLHDDVFGPASADLPFIADKELRDSLRVDIASANRSLSVADWKGCTVVAGSVVEALLLWALEVHKAKAPGDVAAVVKSLHPAVLTQQPPTDILRWGLHELTEVTHALTIITSTTAAQCRIAKDFRNLIHPGRAARLSLKPTLGTSLSALAAIEHVIEDLS